MSFRTVKYQESGRIGAITVNRSFRNCLNDILRETGTRVLVITCLGCKFFCIGEEKTYMEHTIFHGDVLSTLEMDDAIYGLQNSVAASVNGFAIGLLYWRFSPNPS